jgi:hypothetical protein
MKLLTVIQGTMITTGTIQLETWPLTRFIPYARNPRRNDHAVDRMVASIREFGFRVPVLARSTGDVIDGHLRLKAAEKLGLTEIPVIICDDWTEAQVKAFRLLVNRSVTWADWDPELLSLELLDLRNLDYNIDLTGFDTQEIDELLLAESDDAHEDDAPDAPENPASIPGDLWLCGPHRILCGDATSPEGVSRLLGKRKPRLMITDPPYGIELDSEWRDRAGLNGCGPAEKSYMKHRTEGHNETTISGDTRADWFASVRARTEPRGCLRLARIEVHSGSSRWPAPDRVPAPPTDHLEQGENSPHEDPLLVPA